MVKNVKHQTVYWEKGYKVILKSNLTVMIIKDGRIILDSHQLSEPDSHLSGDAIEAGATLKTHANMGGIPIQIEAAKALHPVWAEYKDVIETRNKELVKSVL